MSADDATHDLIDAVALGIASPEEISLAKSLAASNPAIARALNADYAVAGLLSTSVDRIAPPRRLRERLIKEVHGDVAVSRSREPRRARNRQLPAFAAAFAGALAAIIVAVALFTVLNEPPVPTTDNTELALAGTAAAPKVRGEALFPAGRATALITLSNLPPAGDGMGYQVWRVRDGAAQSAGFLNATGNGRAEGLATKLAGVDEIAVTVERLNNRVGPTSAPIIRITVPEATTA